MASRKRKSVSNDAPVRSKRQRVKVEESKAPSGTSANATSKEPPKPQGKANKKELTLIKVKEEVKKEDPEEDVSVLSEESESEDEDDSPKMSEFEKKRQENLKANAEFFAQLGILQAKHQLQNTMAEPKPVKPSQRGINRTSRKQSPPPRRQPSLRIRRIDPEGLPLPPPPELVTEVVERSVTQRRHKSKKPSSSAGASGRGAFKGCSSSSTGGGYKLFRERARSQHRPPAGPVPMTDCLFREETEDLHQKLCSTMRTHGKVVVKVPAKPTPQDSYVKGMGGLGMTENSVAKVVAQRIYSLAIHPAPDKLLVAAGDRDGHLGLWDVLGEDRQDGVVMYSPHASPVTCLRFPAHNTDKLLSSSYDGSLRRADFNKGVFEEIYSLPEEDDILLRWFDFHSAHTLLVARQDGCVALVDTRTKGTEAEHVYQLHKKSLRTVSIHPLQTDFFVTSSTDKTASLWDLRQAKSKAAKPVAVMEHTKSVDSAYFSPLSGCHILTSSSDDFIRVFDVKSSCASVELKRKIRHCNYTGRYLTNFRPTWHPLRDDLFVSGSMDRPRKIELFNAEGSLVKFYRSDFLGSVCSINEIHPTRNIIAGGNSSGRVHVFM